MTKTLTYGLQSLPQKIIKAEYLRMAWISAGMDYGSAMRAEPGIVFDLVELHNRANRVKDD